MTHTESDACQMYQRAILDHREDIEACLSPRPWVHLEAYGCLCPREIEEMKGLPGTASARIRKVVDLVLARNDLQTFTAFCKAIHAKTAGGHKWKTVFPFADHLGGIPVTEPKKALPQPSDKPVALWLTVSEKECTSIRSAANCRVNGPKTNIGAFTCQEFVTADSSSFTIHVAYPSSSSGASIRDLVDLLYQFSPRPHLAVMTGTCCANTGEAELGDVCVITPQSEGVWGEPSLMAETQHMLEVWRLEQRSLVPEGLKLPQSVFQQMTCLARIHTELQLPEDERSRWFQDLELDLTGPLSQNSGIRRCLPEPDTLLRSNAAAGLWSYDETSPLHYVPCDRLCDEAKASMKFSSQNHSFVTDPPQEPKVLFGRASRFRQSKGRMVACPRVVDFYKAALMVNKKTGMKYVAALGVSSVDGQDCQEKDYEQFASTFSVHIMSKIVKHVFEKL